MTFKVSLLHKVELLVKCTCLAEAENALRWQALKICLEANMADYIKEEIIEGFNSGQSNRCWWRGQRDERELLN